MISILAKRRNGEASGHIILNVVGEWSNVLFLLLPSPFIMTTTKYIFAIIMHDKLDQEQSSQNDSRSCLRFDLTHISQPGTLCLPKKLLIVKRELPSFPQQPQGHIYTPTPKLHSETERADDGRC